jgi:hypothetical protein
MNRNKKAAIISPLITKIAAQTSNYLPFRYLTIP